MKTFKFLTLSLLIATAGLYSSMNIAEASDNIDNNKKLIEKFKEFRLELIKQTGTRNLQDISQESRFPVSFLRECITIRLPLMKKIEKIYSSISPANRTLQNVTETLNKFSNYKYSEQLVARWLKVLGYELVDNKENKNNSYKECISNNVQEDVSENEKKVINDEIMKKGNTIKTVAKKFGKSEEEIKKIFMESWDLVPIVSKIWNDLSQSLVIGSDDIHDLFNFVWQEYKNGEGKGTEILFRQVKEICDKFEFPYTDTEDEYEQ